MGECPIFNISINKNREAVLKAESFNVKQLDDTVEVKGTFRTRLDEITYSEIINLLNYINFPDLKQSYFVEWSDAQACRLNITYGNGMKKSINDYGKIGTYGLRRLYQLLFNTRFNQQWK